MPIVRKNPIVRFDPQRRASSSFRRQLNDFIAQIERREIRLGVRKRTRRANDRERFRLALEALVCNLLIVQLCSPRAVLSIPRAHNSMWGKSRYRDDVYGQHFLSAVDLLCSLRFAQRKSQGYRFSKAARQPTTIVPTAKFNKVFANRKMGWAAFSQASAREPLILKASKDAEGLSRPIEYGETKRTAYLRQELIRINEWLRNAPLTVVTLRDHAPLDEMGQPIELYRRELRRIFNNRSWQEGGRLFGGFWMTMERAQRFNLIRIASEPVVNVDFSALFPRLAYVHTKTKEPQRDLYDITGDGSCRDGWKKLFNALLFTNRPLKQWPKETRELFPDELSLRDAISAIKEGHAPIINQFERGIGFRFMKIESDMLLTILASLFRKGIVALPLHDSVLVARSKGRAAKAVMEKVYKQTTGRQATVKIDSGSI